MTQRAPATKILLNSINSHIEARLPYGIEVSSTKSADTVNQFRYDFPTPPLTISEYLFQALLQCP